MRPTYLIPLVFGLLLLGALQPKAVHAAPSSPKAMKGWCTIIPEQPGTECFPDPMSACRRQWEGYSSPANKFEGYKPTAYWNIKHCDWVTHADGGPYSIFPTSVSFWCDGVVDGIGYATVYPGRCVPAMGFDWPEERPVGCPTNGAAGSPNPTGGTNPIVLSTGAKYESELDFTTADGRLRLERAYRSFLSANVHNGFIPTPGLDANWRYAFSYQLRVHDGFPILPWLTVYLPDGTAYDFKRLADGTLVSDDDDAAQVPVSLAFIGDWPDDLDTIPKTSTRWQLTLDDNRVVTFETVTAPGSTFWYTLARPIRIADRDGYQQTFSYDERGVLASITDSFGRTLGFTWLVRDPASYGASTAPPVPMAVDKVTFPDGTAVRYRYDSIVPFTEGVPPQPERLIAVDYLDKNGTLVGSRTYHYEDPRYFWALTGITDERGVRVANWAYDDLGRAVSSEGAEGQNRHTVEYVDGTDLLTRTVTNPLGKKTTYQFTHRGGAMRLTGVNGEPSQHCVGTTRQWEYDSQGYVKREVDEKGRATDYTVDGRGLPTRIVEAAGTAAARTTEMEWHPAWRLPLKRSIGAAETRFGYDAQGRLLQLERRDRGTGSSRLWQYNYTDEGLLTSEDGPVPGTADTVHYTYDAAGYLKTLTNPLGQRTTVLSTNGRGLPTQILDANGVRNRFVYDARGRLTSTTRDSTGVPETVRIAYDPSGQVVRVTAADGSFLAYTWDAAGRLQEIRNRSGDRVAYQHDAAGNVLQQIIRGSSSGIALRQRQTFDELGRRLSQVGALGQQWRFQYDQIGNLIRARDPLGHQSTHAYDSLDRLTRTTDAAGGVTRYQYDELDRLRRVIDPLGLATSYAYDGLGNLTRTASPDAGITRRTYDEAGNVLTSTDARGLTTQFTYDAAHRLTAASFADGQRIVYRYDTGPHGVGRLAQIADATGNLSWSYDALGRVTTRRQRTVGLDLLTRYTYDDKGRLATMTYPSGPQMSYAYDPSGRISGISVDGQPVVTQIRYQPFGRASGWNWGNGTPYARKFDRDGRLIEFPLGSELRTLTYDAADRIIAFADPGQQQEFGYDVLNRLTSHQSDTTQIGYDYDRNGNRLHLTENTGETAYTYGDSDNRLIGRSGSQATTYHYDAAGNLLDDDQHQFTYDARGRMVSVSSTGGTTRYGINGLGQRVYKSGAGVSTGTIRFAYDEAGHLIGEYDKAGNAIQETIWFDNAPLAVMSKGQIYNVFADQLGTPRVLTDQRGSPVWRWQSDPFGNGVPSGIIAFNLRLPGQYYDPETGLHYNYHRDYDPGVGRYVQSDPIGLQSPQISDLYSRKLNLFLYTDDNPLNFIDFFGLQCRESVRRSDTVAPNIGALVQDAIDLMKLGGNENARQEEIRRVENSTPQGTVVQGYISATCNDGVCSFRFVEQQRLELPESGGLSIYGAPRIPKPSYIASPGTTVYNEPKQIRGRGTH